MTMFRTQTKEKRSRMIETKLFNRAERPKRLAILGIIGATVLTGAVVARRLRSGAGDMPEAHGAITNVKKGMVISLVGHEFGLLGHRFHILESARDTGDGTLRFDYTAPPRANISEHVHRHQEESFEVVSGKLGLRVGGQEIILKPGQSGVGPPKVPHAWWNPSDDEEVRFLVGIRPGLDVETMLETVLGLMRDGKTIGSIPRNPLQLAVLAREIGGWVVMTPAEKALFAPVVALAFVGELFGYRARYPQYSGPDGRGSEESM
jgi:quercetin dioxygenase-like cupin family protein